MFVTLFVTRIFIFKTMIAPEIYQVQIRVKQLLNTLGGGLNGQTYVEKKKPQERIYHIKLLWFISALYANRLKATASAHFTEFC